ncbi:MAG: beta-galactosidase trimerization domain-containing protein, partial [Thermomicrobiales bacterium]|nr:beta-galactosidase trimerization domain-containing protein [Thermomicrobiales bacterium]
AVALWTAQAWAHGCDVVCYFRDRGAPMAQELLHSGLFRHDDSLDRGGAEVAGLELSGRPNSEAPAPVVLLHDYESLWLYDAQPHSADANYWDQMLLFYRVLRGLGVDVDVRHPDQDLAGYALIVAPALQVMDETRAAGLTDAARQALLVVGPRTGFRDSTGRVAPGGQPGPLAPLLGCALRNFDGMRPGLICRVGEHTVEIWAESYAPHGGTVVERYADGPLAGEPAVIRHGNATTIGAWSASLVRETLCGLLVEAGLPTRELPDGVRVSRRSDIAAWMNFNEEPTAISDGTTLEPVSFELRPG